MRLSISHVTTLLAVAICTGGTALTSFGQSPCDEVELIPSVTGAGHWFGGSVAIDGDHAVVMENVSRSLGRPRHAFV